MSVEASPGSPPGRVLACSSCGAPIPAEAIEVEAGLAHCVYCRSVLDLIADRSRRGPYAALDPASLRRPAVALPQGVTIRRGPERLEIVRSWRTGSVWFMAFLALSWNGMILYHAAAALRRGVWPLLGILVMPHLWVGLMLLYVTLAEIVNHTDVTVTRRSIRVRQRPLPWSGETDLSSESVKQIFCVERTLSSSKRYDVRALTKRGRKALLIKDLLDVDQALFVEQEIEIHLGIRDEPVGGELPRIAPPSAAPSAARPGRPEGRVLESRAEP